MERHVLMNSGTSLMFSAVGLTLLSEVQISSVHSFHAVGTHKNINISIDTTEQRVVKLANGVVVVPWNKINGSHN